MWLNAIMKPAACLGLLATVAACATDLSPSPNKPQAAIAQSTEEKAQSPGYLDARDRPSRMLSLTLKLTDNGVVVLNSVEGPNTLNRRSGYENMPTFYRVADAAGQTIFERGFRLETTIRSETNGPNGQIEGHHFEVKEPIFSAKVPLFPDTDVIRFYRNGPDGTRANPELLGEVKP